MFKLNWARAIAPLTVREFLTIAGFFWLYVAVSNVLYAEAMDTFAAGEGREQMFADWSVRLVQHLLMFPLLLVCYATALRIGWSSGVSKVIFQLLLAFVLALAARPALAVAEGLLEPAHYMDWPSNEARNKPPASTVLQVKLAVWLASATSFLVAYGFGLALLTGFSAYRRLRDRESQMQKLQAQWTESRLSALKMQLSPHMLFNLLNTLRGQIVWDPPAAQKMVVQLADLLRRLLSAGEKNLVPLRDEIQFVSVYLELQQQRFSDRLQVRLPKPNEVPQIFVPSLILQPLIENAVVHGLARHEGPVVVELSCSESAGRLRLRIDNNFAPVPGPEIAGVGIDNVRERLRVQFGDQAELRYGPTDHGLWRAEIELPAHSVA